MAANLKTLSNLSTLINVYVDSAIQLAEVRCNEDRIATRREIHASAIKRYASADSEVQAVMEAVASKDVDQYNRMAQAFGDYWDGPKAEDMTQSNKTPNVFAK